MGCKEIQKLLPAYINKELTPEFQELTDRHLSNCAECRHALSTWIEVRRKLSTLREIPEFPNLRDATISKIKQYETGNYSGTDSYEKIAKLIKRVNTGKIFSPRPKWKIATIGTTLLAVMVILTFALLSSGGYDTLLAADIARSSPEVKKALGGDNIQILQIVEEKDIVVCSSGMQPPIAVKIDLKSKTVVDIADVDLPQLTDEEQKLVIDLAKSSPLIYHSLEGNNIQNIEVYPVFVSGTVITEIGEITLPPGPEMVVVRFDLEEDPSVIKARIDLDAMMVTETHEEGETGNIQSITSIATPIDGKVTRELDDPLQENMEKIKEEAKNNTIEIIEADPIGKVLLDQGFSISTHDIWITFNDNYLESDNGNSIAVYTPSSAMVELRRGYTVREAFVDLLKWEVQWVSPALGSDTLSRESVQDILSESAKTSGLLKQGAKTYVFGYRSIEYCLSEDGRLSGKLESSNFITVWLIIDDGLWMAQVDISAGEVISLRELPSELQLSSSAKDEVLTIIQSQSEVIELLNDNAEVLYFLGPSDQVNTDYRNGIAILHIEGTTYFWEAHVDLEKGKFVFLNRL
ncbi:MAG: zf-HC2 domain-containing protein [Dehalococcoidia bacterium]